MRFRSDLILEYFPKQSSKLSPYKRITRGLSKNRQPRTTSSYFCRREIKEQNQKQSSHLFAMLNYEKCTIRNNLLNVALSIVSN